MGANVAELEPIIGPLAAGAMTVTIDDGVATLQIPPHLALWIGDKQEIKLSGATSYKGKLPFDRRIRFPVPAGSNDLTIRLETKLFNDRPYEETLVVKRAPKTKMGVSATG